jgi:hypothetical protein
MFAELSKDPFAIAVADLPGVTATSIVDQFRRRVACAIACRAVIATDDRLVLPLAYACPFTYEVMFASLHRSLIAVVGAFDIDFTFDGKRYFRRNAVGTVVLLKNSPYSNRGPAQHDNDVHVVTATIAALAG